jgi:hypothetical protein
MSGRLLSDPALHDARTLRETDSAVGGGEAESHDAQARCAFRDERRSRSKTQRDRTTRTCPDPASFRPIDGTMSRVSTRRKAQELRLP